MREFVARGFSAETNLSPPCGRAMRGARLNFAVPHGPWRTTTFLCGLRPDGPVAPPVIDGAVNGPMFPAWVRQRSPPTLCRGDVVVMNDLSAHKVRGGRCVSRHLPAHNSDLNPIELMFSKLTRLIRVAGERAVEALWTRIGELLSRFPPAEGGPNSENAVPDATPCRGTL